MFLSYVYVCVRVFAGVVTPISFLGYSFRYDEVGAPAGSQKKEGLHTHDMISYEFFSFSLPSVGSLYSGMVFVVTSHHNYGCQPAFMMSCFSFFFTASWARTSTSLFKDMVSQYNATAVLQSLCCLVV